MAEDLAVVDRSLAPFAAPARDGPRIGGLTLSLAEGDQPLVSKMLAKAAATRGEPAALAW